MATAARRVSTSPSTTVSTILAILCMLGPFAAPTIAAAQSAPAAPQDRPEGRPPGPTSPEAAARALEHFQRAKDLYQSGAYHEAIAELRAANEIDPNAKDLVFNLGVVHEKLGLIDEALRYFRHYATMDLTAEERSRADAYIRRLEGAKIEVVHAPTATATAPAPPPPKPPPEGRGRIDAATILSGGVAVIGLAAGTGFGVKALLDRPKSGFVTGPDGTYDQLADATRTSHAEAVVADISFGVGLAAALLTAYLYFGRSKNHSATAPATSGSVSGTLLAAPIVGGGAVFLGGTF